MSSKCLDLFCGAGGAAMGYHRAGFEVVGVDIKPQPRYPFEFIQADIMTFSLEGYDFIHASPPCQGYSTLAAMHPQRIWPKLIDRVRERLMAIGVAYAIENVETAPLNRASDLFGNHGVMLCGSMFNLRIERGYLRRHRLFETSFPIPQPPCHHKGRAVGVYGHGGHTKKHRMLYKEEAAEIMQIDWMNRDELSQAIPPAYTEFIGHQAMQYLKQRVSA